MKRKLKSIKARIPTASPNQVISGDSWRDGLTSSSARGYTYEWQAARLEWLREHPLCVMCEAAGVVCAATVVDHKRPHRGEMAIFWDRTNWQSLCKPCHDIHKQRQDAAQLTR